MSSAISLSLIALALTPSAALVVGLTPSASPLASHAARGCRSRAVVAALDYKDPVVAEEFTKVQALDTEGVEEELAASGIPVPPTMNDMDMRMMLVEMRMRKSGKMGGEKKKKKPPPPPAGASAFEVALYEKPALKKLYEEWQQMRNTNALNIVTEYLNNPRRCKERYGGTAKYDETVVTIETALNAKVEQEVTTGKISYDGFPANMGEAGVQMTLAAFGELASFTFEANDDGLTCSGTADYGDVALAKAAIDKYDGMDMGLGTKLEITAD